MIPWKGVLKFVAHGRRTLKLVQKYGWRPAARYTNMRDVRGLPFKDHGFLDIHWKRYDFARHLEAVAELRPLITVARDVERHGSLEKILKEADSLSAYARVVIVVPKDPQLAECLNRVIPAKFLLGFSVPTRYGGTSISPEYFRRPVHLLGGRPDVQRALAARMHVVSLDCNRFTLDAQFGDYFDGDRFRPHPKGGYHRCLADSVKNIDRLWQSYRRKRA